ncbi:BamA/TamA family outer membrane protein [Eisenibacter elegans]|uniref:translocation and assembly module lipoprotein TamL n=1 Tax=Eisenibacter elegans TaxID=997 RepID=UPI0013767106|nr:BamA/TamA family outer membrane protein [Eisenibacter elegans]
MKYRHILENRFRWLSVLCGLSLGLGSCISTKTWKEGSYMFVKEEFKGNKTVSSYDLYELSRQKPNATILITKPYVWLYQIGERFYNQEKANSNYDNAKSKYSALISEAEQKEQPKKVLRLEKKQDRKLARLEAAKEKGNMLMRIMGEPPVFYDRAAAEATRESVGAYLRTKGFFDNTVRLEEHPNERKQRMAITFQVQENERRYLRDIQYNTFGDTALDSLLKAHSQSAKLKPGQPYDESNFSTERVRIEQEMRNNGYFNFSRQYILFKLDTTVTDSLDKRKLIDVTVLINPIAPKVYHKIHYISDIRFYSNDPRRRRRSERRVEYYPERDSLHQVSYTYESEQIYYSPKVLSTRIKTQPGDRYSQDRISQTQRAMANLDMFKFVNMSFDTTATRFAVNIFTNPLQKFNFSAETGMNITQGARVPAPFVNFSIRDRNLFQGCEILEAKVQYSLDAQAGFSQQQDAGLLYTSQEFNVTTSLIFPQVLFPSRLRFQFNRFNPQTRLSLGVNYTQRPEYTRSGVQTSINYLGTLRQSTFQLTLVELNVVNTLSISRDFDLLLRNLERQGNPIRQSFDRAFVSSTYFTYTYNEEGKEGVKHPRYLRTLVELGGNIPHLLSNATGAEPGQLFNLKYFQFWRLTLTGHYRHSYPNKKALAFRVHSGIAAPFNTSNTLPYEKFFFGGGSNSLRAWQPRRLGPGSYAQFDERGRLSYTNEQPGEIILEANIEYRFPMFSFIHGAFFVDAGNTWMISPDPTRPGANFEVNRFYEEIAIGTGFGLRFDFSFLILRFDAGLKVYNPGLPARDALRWSILDFDWRSPFSNNQLLLNIGIGYPF